MVIAGELAGRADRHLAPAATVPGAVRLTALASRWPCGSPPARGRLLAYVWLLPPADAPRSWSLQASEPSRGGGVGSTEIPGLPVKPRARRPTPSPRRSASTPPRVGPGAPPRSHGNRLARRMGAQPGLPRRKLPLHRAGRRVVLQTCANPRSVTLAAVGGAASADHLDWGKLRNGPHDGFAPFSSTNVARPRTGCRTGKVSYLA